jgi:hypothetical protein
MSIAQTAILATAIRPRSSERVAKPTTTTISESIAQRPIQWLIVAGTVIYFGGKFIKNAIPSGVNLRKEEAETSTSAENPWSYKLFLSGNKIPVGTNLLTAAKAYEQAKKVYDALNTYFTDNADMVVGVFAALPSKVQVAQVVQAFDAYFKRDILQYMQEGKKTFDFGTGGISDVLYNRIIENVKRKPKF